MAPAGIFTDRSPVGKVGYVPGPLTAVAGEFCLALVETAPDSPAAAWIWQQAGQGASAQALLAGLLGAGFDGVGGFTLLDQPAGGPLRLFCRGAVAATVVSGTAVAGTVVGGTVLEGTVVDGTTAGSTGAADAASARIDGVGLLTWREHVVAADAERIYLGQPPDDGAVWLPAAAGVLLAGSVIVDLAQAAPSTAPRPGVRAAGHPDADSSEADKSDVGGSAAGGPYVVDSGGNVSAAGAAVEASPDAGAAVATSARPDATDDIGPADAPDHAADSGVSDHSIDAVTGAPADPADADLSVPDAPAAADSDVIDAATGGPDHAAAVPDPPAPGSWFEPSGASRIPDPPSAAPEPDAAAPIAGAWERPSGSSNGQWSTPPLDVEPKPTAAPPGPEGADGLIDPVSWGAGPGAPAAPLPQRKPALVVAPPPGLGPELDGLTVKRADPVPPPESPPESSAERIGPDVPALICPTGHVNPPSETVCRQCGAALPPDPVIVPRPLLGVLRLSTGDVLTLDRDMVLGRNPPADLAGINGEDRPQVVRLPSEDGVISRTHLRVTLTGWHVLVTDLNSTNGTKVTMPGRDPEPLPPGVPVPIRPGTVVALAEGIDFRYEAP
jgi:FHA domain